MRTTKPLSIGTLTAGVATLLAISTDRLGWPALSDAEGQQSAAVRIDADDIGGVVTSANRPEVGVWVTEA